MKFKDLWIKPTPDGSPEAGPAPTPAAVPLRPAPIPVQNQAPATVGASDGDTTVFVTQLENALEKANLPTQQDYLDFSKSLHNLESLPMDEATRYKAAYAALQSFGCDLRQLLESFDYYQGILDGEKDKFDEAMRSAVSENVTEKEKDIKDLTGENDDHAAEIQKLNAAITLNQQKIAKLQAELGDINTRLNQRKAGFLAAYTTLKQRLQSDETKLKTYLAAELSAQSSSTSRK